MFAQSTKCAIKNVLNSHIFKLALFIHFHAAANNREDDLRLRRVNRIRAIRGSLAIEGNTLSEEQMTAILEGKLVVAPPREIQEVRNDVRTFPLASADFPEKLLASRFKSRIAGNQIS